MENEVKAINAKAQKFVDFLADKNIQCFQQEQAGDELNTVVFRSAMEVSGSNLPTLVILDDSVYGIVRVQLAAKALKEGNKEKLLEYVNEQNRKYKVFKYYILENGDINLDSCVLLTEDKDAGEKLYVVIDVILKHLQANYPELMNKIWG